MDTNTYINAGIPDSPSIPNLTAYAEKSFASNMFPSGDQVFADEQPEDPSEGMSVNIGSISSEGE